MCGCTLTAAGVTAHTGDRSRSKAGADERFPSRDVTEAGRRLARQII